MHQNARNNRTFQRVIKQRRARVMRLNDRREKDIAAMRRAHSRTV